LFYFPINIEGGFRLYYVKKWFVLSLLLCLLHFLSVPSGFAETSSPKTEVKKEVEDNKKADKATEKAESNKKSQNHKKVTAEKEEKASVEEQKKEEKEKKLLLKQIKKEEKYHRKQVKLLDVALTENQEQIKDLKKKIKKSKTSMASYKKEIKQLNQSMDKREAVLKDRAVALQEQASKETYLEILLGSTNFQDFIQRIEVMSAFMEADREMIQLQQKDVAALKKKKQQQQNKLRTLTDAEKELETVKQVILKQKEQQKELIKLINTKKINTKEEIAQLRNTLYLFPTGTTKPNGSLPEFVKVGYRWIDHSVYVFGGGRNSKDVSLGVFDCSSFVHWAFQQTGVELGERHSVSTETLNKLGKRITFAEIQPGDIVFFDTYKVDGHIGIYVGNGKFIGAQSSTGVAIADMSTGYWASKFKGHIRRIQ